MKNSMKIAVALMAGFGILFAACKKKEDNVSETVKVQYPIITLKGDKYVTIGIGGSFTDPGATMFDSFTMQSSDLAPTQSGVDNTTPGMYPIIYEGKNKYGFTSREVRWVAVTAVPDAEDIGGLYKRNINGSPVNVTEVTRGIYRVDNIGGVNGVPDFIYDMYFVQLSDTSLNFPAQPGPFGTTYTNSESINKSVSDTVLSWRVIGPSFGTAIRVFNHQ